MTNQEQRINTAEKISKAASHKFLVDGRELFASFHQARLQETMLAHIRLHYGITLRDADPELELYLDIQRKTFLNLYDRGVLVPAYDITPLGQLVIDAMRVSTGQGLELLPPPPPPTFSPEQALEEKVKQDWRNLSSKQMRDKVNNDRAYRECFQRLSETNDIGSSITQKVVIQGV